MAPRTQKSASVIRLHDTLFRVPSQPKGQGKKREPHSRTPGCEQGSAAVRSHLSASLRGPGEQDSL